MKRHHLWKSERLFASFVLGCLVLASLLPISSKAQGENPYQVIYHWGELSGGREMGVVTGVQPDPDGEHIWILERCGSNQCAGSSLNPIHKLDLEGNTVMSIGAGLFAWPHGFDMDEDGNLYIASYSGGWVDKFVPKPGADPSKLLGGRLLLTN